jgi:copper chaperone
MELRIEVENVKCGGCARTIENGLRENPHITRVTVDPAQRVVMVEADADVRAEAVATLARLGYPEKGSVEGVRSAAAKAKSVVSCAIGRLAP